MPTHRKVVIKNIHKVFILHEKALCKLIRYYYKGHNHININFDNRISAYAMHRYKSISRTHEITVSPMWCYFEKKNMSNRDFEAGLIQEDLNELNDFDYTCKIIQCILHELKHAMQCDVNPIRYIRCTDDKHPMITNTYLKYKYSVLEAEAEGWSLVHFNRALDRYLGWVDEYERNQE